jgi:hypothetical protein
VGDEVGPDPSESQTFSPTPFLSSPTAYICALISPSLFTMASYYSEWFCVCVCVCVCVC